MDLHFVTLARFQQTRWREERRFEPSVPLAVKTLLGHTFPEILGCAAAILEGMVAASARSTASGAGLLAADHLDHGTRWGGLNGWPMTQRSGWRQSICTRLIN